jgi:regulator of protease activity HflC (stomatin/prohibitin superfamily)
MDRFRRDESEYSRSSGGRRFPIAPVAAAVIAAVLVISLILGGFRVIDGSQAGVYTVNGNPSGQRGPGLNLKMPFFHDIAIYTARIIQVEAVGIDQGESPEAAIGRSGAEIVELASDAKAKGGQLIDQAPFRLWYRVPPSLFKVDADCNTILDESGNPIVERQDNLSWLYNNIGKNDELVRNSAVMGPARQVVKDVLLQFAPEQLIGFIAPSSEGTDNIQLYSDINGEINRRVKASLCLDMHAQGVVLEDFAIGKLDFNDRFETKIAETQEAAQQVEIEENNVLAAEQRALAAEKEGEGIAKKEVAEANGRAQANEREATGRAAARRVEAAANAEAIAAEGAAQAKAHQLDVEAVGGPDRYVQIQIAEQIGQWRPVNLLGGEGGGVIPLLNLNDAGGQPAVVPVETQTAEEEEAQAP